MEKDSLSQILDVIPANIVAVGCDGKIIYANRQWMEFGRKHGANPARIGVGINYFNILREAIGSDVTEAVTQILTGFYTVINQKAEKFEYEYSLSIGQTSRRYMVHALPFGDGEGLVICHVDITAQRVKFLLSEQRIGELQSALDECVSDVALAQVTQGVVHDFNNLLIVLSGEVIGGVLEDIEQMVIAKQYELIPAKVERGKEIIERIREAVELARTRIKSISSLARKGEKKAENITAIIEAMLSLLDSEFRHKEISIHRDFPSGKDLLKIFCNRSDILNLLLNLFVNSMQAMEKSLNKIIFVKTEKKERDIIVTVADTGKGIPGEYLEKVFDRGFSAGKGGLGTGFGLSFAKKVMEDHNGAIEVQSKVGEGTKIILTFKAEK